MIWISAIYTFQIETFIQVIFEKSFQTCPFFGFSTLCSFNSSQSGVILWRFSWDKTHIYIRFKHMKNTAIMPIEFLWCNWFWLWQCLINLVLRISTCHSFAHPVTLDFTVYSRLSQSITEYHRVSQSITGFEMVIFYILL